MSKIPYALLMWLGCLALFNGAWLMGNSRSPEILYFGGLVLAALATSYLTD